MEEELDERLGEMADSEVELSLLLIELFRLMVSTRPIESFGSLHLDSLKLVPLETCFNMVNVKDELFLLIDWWSVKLLLLNAETSTLHCTPVSSDVSICKTKDFNQSSLHKKSLSSICAQCS